ncbi:Flp family type IVb pilin [Xenophilus arseniciresistens]
MMEKLVAFWRDEEGATAIEYGLIAGLIAVGLIAALTSLEGGLTALFGRIVTALNGLTA